MRSFRAKFWYASTQAQAQAKRRHHCRYHDEQKSQLSVDPSAVKNDRDTKNVLLPIPIILQGASVPSQKRPTPNFIILL